jgi:hypothetical protein
MIDFLHVSAMHPIYNLKGTVPNKPVMTTAVMLLHAV